MGDGVRRSLTSDSNERDWSCIMSHPTGPARHGDKEDGVPRVWELGSLGEVGRGGDGRLRREVNIFSLLFHASRMPCPSNKSGVREVSLRSDSTLKGTRTFRFAPLRTFAASSMRADAVSIDRGGFVCCTRAEELTSNDEMTLQYSAQHKYATSTDTSTSSLDLICSDTCILA